MWANSVLKWAEQTLENVDRSTAGASKKLTTLGKDGGDDDSESNIVDLSGGDDDSQLIKSSNNSSDSSSINLSKNSNGSSTSGGVVVVDNVNFDKIREEAEEELMNEFSKKSESERLEQALLFAKDCITQSSIIGETTVQVEGGDQHSTTTMENQPTQQPEISNDQSVIITLYDQFKKVDYFNRNLKEHFNKLTSQSKHSQRYNTESQNRLEEQLSRLLEEKVKTDTELTNALSERDRQAQKYQSRVDALVEQMKLKDLLISEMQGEKDMMANEQLRYEKSTAEEITKLKQQIEDIQNQQKETKKEEKQTHKKMEQLEFKHQEVIRKLKEEYSELESTLNEKLDEISRLESNIKLKEQEWQAKNQEYLEYKNRAANLLSVRDKQIEELKKSGSESSENREEKSTDDDTDLMNALDKEDMLLDLENLKADNQELQSQIDLMKRQHEAEMNTLRFKLKNLEKNLEKEKQTSAKYQENITSLKLNFDEMKHQYENEKKLIKDQLKEKKEEINQLQKQLNQAKYNSSSNQNELELRNRAMAERLIEKQSQLETVNSEKAAIQLDLEKCQLKIRELQLIAQVTPISIRNNYTDEESPFDNEAPPVSVKSDRFFRDLSKRGFVARRVAHVMAFIDSFSISTGSILRRLPLLRILLVLYIISLHIWVFYILSHLAHLSH